MKSKFGILILICGLIVILMGCSGKSEQTPVISPIPTPKTESPALSQPTTNLIPASTDSAKNVDIPANLKPGGLRGEYFVWRDYNNFFPGTPALTRIDNEIGFNWEVYAADSKIPDDHFSVRWSGYIMVDKEDDYRLRLDADDGAQLTIDDKQIFPMSLFSRKETMHLTKGLHKIQLDYYEDKGVALCYLFWSESPYKLTSLIPSDHLYYEETVSAPQPVLHR